MSPLDGGADDYLRRRPKPSRSLSVTQAMATLQRQQEIEQFLYHEAWLLERRRFTDWLKLLTQDVAYWIPNAGEDSDIGDDAVIVYENFSALRARAARSLDPSNPSQIPPPRTKYFVTNVTITDESESLLQARASVLLYVLKDSRLEAHPISCEYRLRSMDDGWRIAFKKVYLISNNQPLSQLPLI